jgi:hypothetical protein
MAASPSIPVGLAESKLLEPSATIVSENGDRIILVIRKKLV